MFAPRWSLQNTFKIFKHVQPIFAPGWSLQAGERSVHWRQQQHQGLAWEDLFSNQSDCCFSSFRMQIKLSALTTAPRSFFDLWHFFFHQFPIPTWRRGHSSGQRDSCQQQSLPLLRDRDRRRCSEGESQLKFFTQGAILGRLKIPTTYRGNIEQIEEVWSKITARPWLELALTAGMNGPKPPKTCCCWGPGCREKMTQV